MGSGMDNIVNLLTEKFIIYLQENSKSENSPCHITSYLNKVFSEYILLTMIHDARAIYTNDLFEHTGTYKDSRQRNQMKKDFLAISDHLKKAEKLIFTTKAGQKLLKNRYMEILQVLSSSAEYEANQIAFSKGKSNSKERIARLEMLLNLRVIAEYYNAPHSCKSKFENIISEIYDNLGVNVSDLSRDIGKEKILNHEKRKIILNFERFFLRKDN